MRLDDKATIKAQARRIAALRRALRLVLSDGSAGAFYRARRALEADARRARRMR